MSDRFKNKVVVVTGGGRGMGRAITLAFANEGAKVMIAARTLSYGEETAEEIRAAGGEAALCQVDVTNQADITNLIDQTVKTFGGVDIVVHNAADMTVNRLIDLTNDDVDRTLNSTIKASIWLMQSSYPYLKDARDGGRFITISSIAGTRTAIPGMCHYAAAKAGINALTANAALELAADGITVNAIEPGITDTDRFREYTPPEQRLKVVDEIPLGRVGLPEEIAHTALFLADPMSGYITGRAITVDGGTSLSSSSGGQSHRDV